VHAAPRIRACHDPHRCCCHDVKCCNRSTTWTLGPCGKAPSNTHLVVAGQQVLHNELQRVAKDREPHVVRQLRGARRVLRAPVPAGAVLLGRADGEADERSELVGRRVGALHARVGDAGERLAGVCKPAKWCDVLVDVTLKRERRRCAALHSGSNGSLTCASQNAFFIV
jgi:hypothetical protein